MTVRLSLRALSLLVHLEPEPSPMLVEPTKPTRHERLAREAKNRYGIVLPPLPPEEDMKPEHVILAAVAPHIPPFRGRGRRKPNPEVQAAADAKRKRKAEKRARDHLLTTAGRLELPSVRSPKRYTS